MSSEKLDDVIPVRTAPVAAGPVIHTVHASGIVSAKDEWELSFKVGGMLARVDVKEGQSVKKGQVLAVLDSTELVAGVRQAREALKKARRDAVRAATLFKLASAQ